MIVSVTILNIGAIGVRSSRYNGQLNPMSYQPARPDKFSTLRKVEDARANQEYHYNMIKGRIAETLIEELFRTMEYNVFRFGMENTVPGIAELLRDNKSDVALTIRRMPDFVVQDQYSGAVSFVEVKFRASGSFSVDDLKGNYPYPNAFVILISRKHIKCLSVKELQNGVCMTPDCHNYLGNRKEFNLDKDLIRDYCQFAIQFFQYA